MVAKTIKKTRVNKLASNFLHVMNRCIIYDDNRVVINPIKGSNTGSKLLCRYSLKTSLLTGPSTK